MRFVKRVVRRLRRDWKKRQRLRTAASLGVTWAEPNYVYKGPFDSNSVVIDVGCASDPDFSLHLIERFGVRAFGVDPTEKHAPALQELQRKLNGRFTHLPLAVAAHPGTLTFHESLRNDSGSILADHGNVLRDETRSYEVEAVTPRELCERAEVPRCDLLKLDLEGAEYELIEALQPDDLAPFAQVFVEFHHHAFERFSPGDTDRAADKIAGFGFERFSVDDHNFLFFRGK